MRPIFGYPLPLFYEDKNDVLKPDFELDMLMPNVIGFLRQKQQREHIRRCFAWNYPIKRLEPLISEQYNLMEEFKRKFKRVSLLRLYYSLRRDGKQRKFRYPVDWFGNLIKTKVATDYLQYCCESDLEYEYPRRNRHDRARVESDICRLKYGVTPERLNELKKQKSLQLFLTMQKRSQSAGTMRSGGD